jgi:predicted dehydrogenase
MAEPVGMGVVGAGAIGIRGALRHLSLPDVQDRVRLAAVCDPVPGRAEAAALQYGVDAWYQSYDDLLADPGVDAVTLCSPIGLHFEQAMLAVQAGKHVHVNKTMTTTVNEADELIARSRKAGVCLVASPGMMLHPHNRRIRRLILEGGLGKLVWAAAGAAISDYHLKEEFRTGESVLTDVDPSWYFRKPGGGPQYDVTVYALHNLTGILGPAQRVNALSGLVLPVRAFRGSEIAADMDDSTLMLLDFGDARFAFVYGTVAGRVSEGFQPSFFGTEGTITGTRCNDRELKRPGDHQPHVVGEHQGMAESHVFEDLMQLVDCVREGTQHGASAEHARHVIDIIESGYCAAETGQTQELRTTFVPVPIEAL